MMAVVKGAGAAAEVEKQRRAVRVNPRDARAHARLGLALQSLGRLEEAVDSQRRALALDPALPGVHATMASALRELGRHEAALECYRQALAQGQDDADLRKGMTASLVRLNQLDAALESAGRAVALAPQDAYTHITLANVQHAVGDFAAATESFRRALEIAPDHAGALRDRAALLMALHRYGEAAECWRSLAALLPGDVDAHLNLAASLREHKDFKASAASYRRVLELDPSNYEALRDIGVSLFWSGQRAEALAAFETVMAIDPDDTITLSNMVMTRLEIGDWTGMLAPLRRALAVGPRSPGTHTTFLFGLCHTSLDREELGQAHRDYGKRWETPLLPLRRPHPNLRDPQRVLRVGFVSGDLYNHAVTTFVEPVFALLKDSARLSLYAYHSNNEEDAVTARLKQYIPNWRSIADLDDEAAERLIREDGIDILFDLSGHTLRNRLPLFARKPAPVQASWIGYPASTGLEAMDYYIGDQFFLPPGRHDSQFTEKIVRLPVGAPFVPYRNAPPVNPLPAARNGYLTFGSFHRPNKLSPTVVAQWSRVLRALPKSRMLLGGMFDGMEHKLVEWFAAEGIDPGRLIVRERAPMRDYLAQHHEVDLCLSPFPYSGTTTICHALWMGVPTLATIGETAPSFAAAQPLGHLGLSSFIAEDDDTLVRLAQFLAQNLPVLDKLRGTMRERFAQAALGYPGIAAASLELACIKMWQRWCAGQAPEAIEVRVADLDEPAPAGA
jgi:predicted O-linked N-acetylglucosamine transferase (SPINDLY family)